MKKLHALFAATLLALSMTSAFATSSLPSTTTSTITLTPGPAQSYGATFGMYHQGGFFTDTFNFTPSFGSRAINVFLQTLGITPSTNMDFYSVKLNGISLSLAQSGWVDTATTSPTITLSGPLSLEVYGKARNASSYTGSLSIIHAVPEPETYALMLAGLIFVGVVVRRRNGASRPAAFA
jgi:hypothetical protein